MDGTEKTCDDVELDDDFIAKNDKKLNELLNEFSEMKIEQLDEYLNIELPQV